MSVDIEIVHGATETSNIVNCLSLCFISFFCFILIRFKWINNKKKNFRTNKILKLNSFRIQSVISNNFNLTSIEKCRKSSNGIREDGEEVAKGKSQRYGAFQKLKIGHKMNVRTDNIRARSHNFKSLVWFVFFSFGSLVSLLTSYLLTHIHINTISHVYIRMLSREHSILAFGYDIMYKKIKYTEQEQKSNSETERENHTV